MTNSVFSDDVCRLCLWSIEPSMPIFSAAGEQFSISEKINAVLPFTVSRNDLLPQNICKDCIYKVENFYDFSCACVRSNEKLKQCLVEKRHPVIYVQDESEEGTVKLEPEEDPIALEFEEEQFTFNSSNMENTCGDLSPPALILDDGTNQDTEPVSLLGISLCDDIEECLDISANEESSSHTAAVAPSCNAEINLSTNRDKQQKTPTIPRPDKEQMHYCRKCSQKFSSRTILNLHYCESLLAQPLSCRYCNRIFSDMNKLTVHEKDHIVTLSVSCKICLKEFPTTKALKAHMNPECPTIQDAVCNDHRYSVTTVPGTNVSIHSPQFTCCTCERSFTTPAALGKHNKSKDHMHNICKLRCGSRKSMNRIDRKSNDHEEIPKQMSCTKEKTNDCGLHPEHMDDKTNYSEENSKQMTASGGRPKRMRRSPNLESSWIVGELKRKYVRKYAKPE